MLNRFTTEKRKIIRAW